MQTYPLLPVTWDVFAIQEFESKIILIKKNHNFEKKNFSIGASKFTCAILDCAEWLGHHPPPGCYRKYALNRCCSTGHICRNIFVFCFYNIYCSPFPILARTQEVATCEFEGATYQEGQKFSPKDTCLTCVCQKGFNGKAEAPFCRRQRCGVQLRGTRGHFVEQRCAPIYSSKSTLCCPDHWACRMFF